MARLFPRLKFARPAPEVVLAGLRRPKFTRLRLDRFPRGLDHLHIDVALGPLLGRAVTSFVNALVREYVQRLWNQEVSGFSGPATEGFAEALKEHHRAVVKEARVLKRPERVQLFQLAVLKLLFSRIDAEVAALRAELEDARSQRTRQLSGQSLKLHEHAVILARHAGHVRYRVAQQAVREIMRLEIGGMKGLRASILGLSWPVPEPMLSNPILQLDGVGSARDFSYAYPMLLHDFDATRRASRCVMQTLAAWLPDNVDPAHPAAPAPRTAVTQRSEQDTARGFHETERRMRGLVGELEINDCLGNWLDLPENATALLGGAEAEWPLPGRWEHPAIGHLQRHLNRQLGSRLARAGLLRSVLASYELSAIYPSLGLTDAETLLFDFLKGATGRRDLLRRLGGLDGVSDPPAVLRRIEELRKNYRRSRPGGRRQLVARFAGDVLRLRRDLKLGWRAFVGMDSLKLLADQRAVARSRADNLLQLFCRVDAGLGARGDVIGHVIVRIEVRGATQLTAQMQRRDISASAHFSRFFFDPISRLLARYEAQKVVVQGDALLFLILEHGGDGVERLAVARACCLAADILAQTGIMNGENDRLGLPRIELGLGVAYTAGPPTYLYDHEQKVTVSPAIDIAQRLASCHAPLRESCPLPDDRGLCVAAPVSGTDGGRADGGALVRYNVNGIELDAAAFAQLNVEIPLRRLKARDKRGQRPVKLFAGVCADVGGESHWLVVREQAVKLWMGRQLLDAENEGRQFYEVVGDSRVIERVRQRLADS